MLRPLICTPCIEAVNLLLSSLVVNHVYYSLQEASQRKLYHHQEI